MSRYPISWLARVLSRSVAVACLPLALWAGYDSAIAYWPSVPLAEVPAVLKRDPLMGVIDTEAHRAQPEWLADNAATVAERARALLRGNPLNATAIRELGELAILQKSGDGLAQFRLVERITRKDIFVQTALIQAAIAENDIPRVMVHYDRVLQSSPERYESVFPILARAIVAPENEQAIGRYKDRAWYGDFIRSALGLGAPPGPVLRLFRKMLPRVDREDGQRISMELIGQLMTGDHGAEAVNVARHAPAFNGIILTSIGFNDATTNPAFSPLTWTFHSDSSGEMNRIAQQSASVIVYPAHTAVLADRATLLARGSYTLSLDIQYEHGEPRATLTVEVRCGDGRPIMSQSLPTSAIRMTTALPLAIPDNCTAQRWQLRANAADSQATSTATIVRAELIHN